MSDIKACFHADGKEPAERRRHSAGETGANRRRKVLEKPEETGARTQMQG